MAQTFEVKDNTLNLIDNSDHRQGNVPLSKEHQATLQWLGQQSLHDFQKQGVFILDSDNSNAADEFGYDRALHKNGYILRVEPNDDGPLTVTTSNLVGFIGHNDLNITIRSRFAAEDGGDFFLYYLVQKVMRLNIINLPISVTDCDSVLNLLAFLFPTYLVRAARQGALKQYQYFRYNDIKLKGTIDVARHLKINLPFQGNIAYHTREFTFDNPVTQLVRHTIEVIRSRRELRQLLELNDDVIDAVRMFEELTPSFARSELLAVVNANLQPVAHPLLTEYLPLQQLCLKILRHENAGLRFDTGSDQVVGLIFDIAYLWEEYVATLLEPLGFEHPSNVENQGWSVGKLNDSDMRRRMRLCPDFLFPNSQGEKHPIATVIADAKYSRYESKSFDERVKSHVFQMMQYMYVFKATHSILLCPAQKAEPNQWHFELYGQGGTVDVMYLHLPQQAQSYAEYCAAMQQAESDFVETIKSYCDAASD